MGTRCFPAWLGASLLVFVSHADAQDFDIGDLVECSGQKGKIARMEPRPGWDEPFYVMEFESSGVTFEYRCVPSAMRIVAAKDSIVEEESLCLPGAKLEGQWGIQWYAVTVRGALNGNGACPVSFDGYGREWDTTLSASQLRPGSTQAVSTTTEADVGAVSPPSGSKAPDGRYRCHKISPGNQLMDIGDLVVSGGQASVPGMPEGWTILDVSVIDQDADGRDLVAVYYRSSAGFNDRLDCLPQ